MTKKQMKRYSTLLIRKMRIKMTVRLYTIIELGNYLGEMKCISTKML